MIEEIIDNHRKRRSAMTGSHGDDGENIREVIKVATSLVGLVIGRGGETIKYIGQVRSRKIDIEICRKQELWSSCLKRTNATRTLIRLKGQS